MVGLQQAKATYFKPATLEDGQRALALLAAQRKAQMANQAVYAALINSWRDEALGRIDDEVFSLLDKYGLLE